MEISNAKIAKLLRNVAAAMTIKKAGNFFQIRAYENASDSIEHSTTEIFDLWQEGKLDLIPGLGKDMRAYLNELFEKGKVVHFESVTSGLPPIFFDLLDIPGVGPKTAEKITNLDVKNLDDLKNQIVKGDLVKKGFSAKLAQNILSWLSGNYHKDKRMLLPYAFAQAQKILQYLKKSEAVLRADSLGSLRRMVATIGDLDFAVCSNKPEEVIKHFTAMPQVSKIIDQGLHRVSVVLQSGINADLIVSRPDSYGALLQHFTGSKNHNIKLRTLALKKGLSLSENGVMKVGDKKIIRTKTEEEFYKLLGMDTPFPEIREDTGEIEAAIIHKLPELVTLEDIKGDLHLHSNFPIKNPSHAPGVDPVEEIVKKAQLIGYKYVGVSDHPLGFSTSSEQEKRKWVEMRTKYIQKLNKSTKSIRVLNGLEIDILGNGELSVPDEVLATLDYCIAGIHSGHSNSKEIITKRIISALENPHVDIISHPTNRLINERESSDVDWDKVFNVAGLNNKIMEINSHPVRLDLRDDLVRLAKKYKVKFIISTDAHEVSQMDNMFFGVSVARRGWAQKDDIINTWDWTEFAKWFRIN
jgi:DNA polymerase (family 10)